MMLVIDRSAESLLDLPRERLLALTKYQCSRRCFRLEAEVGYIRLFRVTEYGSVWLSILYLDKSYEAYQPTLILLEVLMHVVLWTRLWLNTGRSNVEPLMPHCDSMQHIQPTPPDSKSHDIAWITSDNSLQSGTRTAQSSFVLLLEMSTQARGRRSCSAYPCTH